MQFSLFDDYKHGVIPGAEVDAEPDGTTYESEFDKERLGAQARRVWDCMCDGEWRTYEEVCDITGDRSQNAVGARLRDFRKEKFGSHTVNHRRRGLASDGLWEYQLIPNLPERVTLTCR